MDKLDCDPVQYVFYDEINSHFLLLWYKISVLLILYLGRTLCVRQQTLRVCIGNSGINAA
jgi:hypothetical protein